MSEEVIPFDREFAEGDVENFYQVINGLQGSKCIRVDRLYGDTFSLHFGREVPNRGRGSDNRGEWVITPWGCDIIGSDKEGKFDSRDDPDDVVLSRVSRVWEHYLEEIRIAKGAVSLRLRFTNAAEITLLADPGFDGDAWMILLPAQQMLAVGSDGSWRIESR